MREQVVSSFILPAVTLVISLVIGPGRRGGLTVPLHSVPVWLLLSLLSRSSSLLKRVYILFITSFYGAGVLFLTDAVLPRHLRLLLLGCCDYGLGDLAGHGAGCGRQGCGLGVEGVFFGDTPLSEVGFGGQGWRRLVEVVKRRVVGDVVWVEVVVVVVLGVRQPILLWLLLWSSGGH